MSDQTPENNDLPIRGSGGLAAPEAPAEPETTAEPENEPAAGRVKPSRKPALIAAAAVLLLALALWGGFRFAWRFSIHSSPEKVTEAYLKSGFTADYDTFFSTVSDFEVRILAQFLQLPERAGRKELADYYRSSDSDSIVLRSVTISITGTEEPMEIDAIHFFYPSEIGVTEEDLATIQRAVKVTAVAESDEWAEPHSYSLVCLQINGKWYVANPFFIFSVIHF